MRLRSGVRENQTVVLERVMLSVGRDVARLRIL